MLAGALCADYAVLTEIIHTLAAVDCMMVSGRQRICDVPLISDPVAAVLWLPVNGVSGNAEGFFPVLRAARCFRRFHILRTW